MSATHVHLSLMAITKLHVKYDPRLNNHTLHSRAEKTVLKGIRTVVNGYLTKGA